MAQVFCRDRTIRVAFKGSEVEEVGAALGVSGASRALLACHRRGPARLWVAMAWGSTRRASLSVHQAGAPSLLLSFNYNQIALPGSGMTRNAYTHASAEGVAETRLVRVGPRVTTEAELEQLVSRPDCQLLVRCRRYWWRKPMVVVEHGDLRRELKGMRKKLSRVLDLSPVKICAPL